MLTLIEAMERRGLSNKDLSRELGCHVSIIPRWKKNTSPGADNRARVERYFGVGRITFGGDLSSGSVVSELKSEIINLGSNCVSAPMFRDLVKGKGLPIVKLARELGCSPSAIHSWLRHRSPSRCWKGRIKKYFGVDEINFGRNLSVETKTPEITSERNHQTTSAMSSPHRISTSEEHTLMQVIRLIGFEEALKRLVR